jgi:hypothetical protein
MPNKLVVCSNPEGDDYVGEEYNADYCNIVEYDWQELKQKIQKYPEVILKHNGKNKDDLSDLITFANLMDLPAPSAQNSFHVNTNKDRKLNSDEVLYLGCSHTAGVGHSSQETVYTHILSNMLNKSANVDSHRGKGNWLTEEKLQTYNLKNATVIIQFTELYRIRLNGCNTAGYEFSKDQSSVFSDKVIASIFLEQVKRIVNLLRSNNAKFCFFQVSSPYPDQSEVTSILTTYKEFVYILDIKLDDALDIPKPHPGPKSHTHWAELINNKFNELY